MRRFAVALLVFVLCACAPDDPAVVETGAPVTTTTVAPAPEVPSALDGVADTTTTVAPEPEPEPAPPPPARRSGADRADVARPQPAAEPDPGPQSSIEELIYSYFGAEGANAVAVARCESGLRAGAIGGGANFGLFQLNRVHAADFEAVTGVAFADGWSDAALNTQYAHKLYSGLGWRPWACRRVL